jgi:hypothetical protein
VEDAGSRDPREETSRGRGFLRALGVLLGCLALAVGSPWLLVMVPLALLLSLLPVSRAIPRFAGLFLLGWILSATTWGVPGDRDLDLGWSVLVGGMFGAASLMRPHATFMARGLAAVVGAGVWGAWILTLSDGWLTAESEIRARITQAGEATTLLMQGWFEGEGGAAVIEAASRTAEIQVLLFPAQLALASLLGLAAAWWFFVRIAEGSSGGLGSWRAFRFPDAWVWLLIAGVFLMVLGGWQEGVGRVGLNLCVFMGALYVVRGSAVLLVISGGLGIGSGLLLVAGLVLAFPVLAAGALFAGLGDTWFDLRSRATRTVSPGSGENS